MALPQTIIDFNNAIESPAKWSVEQENIFIDIMAAQVEKGNKMTTTFTKGIWQTIRIEFYVTTGRKYKLKQFQNKFQKLRQRYREFTDLKKLPSGFGWDPILNTVTAPNDVWERYLKVHPEAKIFRRETCIKYNELMIIFGDTTATGKEALASTQGVSESDNDSHDIPHDTTSAPADDTNIDNKEESQQIGDHRRSRDETASASRRVKSRQSRTSELSDAIALLANASYARTEALS